MVHLIYTTLKFLFLLKYFTRYCNIIQYRIGIIMFHLLSKENFLIQNNIFNKINYQWSQITPKYYTFLLKTIKTKIVDGFKISIYNNCVNKTRNFYSKIRIVILFNRRKT